MASKQTLREVYLSKRLTLSDIEYQLRCELITERILNLVEENGIDSVHLFLPILKKKEFNSYPLINELKIKGVTIYIPKVVSNSELEHFILDDQCVIEENSWGIPEPVKGNAIKEFNADLILVPLIIADKKGHRIGYGKGFYDRFLKEVNSKTVGISLLPLLDEIPFVESNDVPLNRIISPFETLILK